MFFINFICKYYKNDLKNAIFICKFGLALGAGVSASAGLATYRGTDGIDTLAALSSKRKSIQVDEDQARMSESDEGDEYSRLIPSFTHTCLANLNQMGKMDYCITQNCDNLHVKGGMPRDCVSDLHGNVFVEYCEKCLTQYYRGTFSSDLHMKFPCLRSFTTDLHM